ncbi:MAG: acetyltransferase [Brevundimonas sp.]|uniref:acetyltransferase n=1 Tax=Brevundimonas sp. TaxID=1871086 RepID=UPI001852BA16|nr:acetyltransferase [Brevundimonas sp.]MBA4804673.1 acetyltransferase [Brevundimonas sp.]
MTERPPLLVLGAGGHARVVADALLAAGESVAGFIDARPSSGGELVTGLPVLGTDEELLAGRWPGSPIANGLGRLPLRRNLQERLQAAGRPIVGARHPAAIISPFAHVDPTAQVFAGAIVQAGARVGAGCIINTGAIIEHDCQLGEFTHCGPGSILCGGVRTGAEVHVGAGAVIREGVFAGPGLVLGAGAAMVRDHEGGGVLTGVPARPVVRA